MAIGERIRFMRNLRGMTQRWLGQAVGFPAKTADIRMARTRKCFGSFPAGVENP